MQARVRPTGRSRGAREREGPRGKREATCPPSHLLKVLASRELARGRAQARAQAGKKARGFRNDESPASPPWLESQKPREGPGLARVPGPRPPRIPGALSTGPRLGGSGAPPESPSTLIKRAPGPAWPFGGGRWKVSGATTTQVTEGKGRQCGAQSL